MTDYQIDSRSRCVIQNFSNKRPFSSFLPGIAGKFGTPLWVFYVNRGQAIACFGVQDKDAPIVEFQPANKAYRLTPYESFRTFIKLHNGSSTAFYEPFAPWSVGDQSVMIISSNELELQATNLDLGISTNIRYFLLTNEPFAGLVRQVTIENTSRMDVELEILDGLPVLIPYGIGDRGLKDFSRTLEAWMDVSLLDPGIPFYRMLASSADTDQVAKIQSGHFYLSFDGDGQLLPVLTDPGLVFGQRSDLQTPENFLQNKLEEIAGNNLQTRGKTPCGFAALRSGLAPGTQVQINSLIGNAPDANLVVDHQARLRKTHYLEEKRSEARQLVEELTKGIHTKSGFPEFDAYCRQTFLDNGLRGGFPVILPENEEPRIVYHLFSRKHGDLERDYNLFTLTPEPFSQGNGNFRDINQNRRNDVFFEPRVGDFNIRTFVNLIQPDGYNPLVLKGSIFTVDLQKLERLSARVAIPQPVREVLSKPFRLGELWSVMKDLQADRSEDQEISFDTLLGLADQSIETEFHEGYWIDHWVYNLDLIEDYLGVYPDKKFDLLFGESGYTYYDSQYFVKPRSEKYVSIGGHIRQYASIAMDAEKSALLESRHESPNFVRGDHGKGKVFYSTLFEKLVLISLLKFTTMDPEGMGIEMEAGRPGWYDALNGLPGLLGSSLPETFELQRLVIFLESALVEYKTTINLPAEAALLLRKTMNLIDIYNHNNAPGRDYDYWDSISSARENYRQQVRFGFSGLQESLSGDELLACLQQMMNKMEAGIERIISLDYKPLPTYFFYEVIEYEYIVDEQNQRKMDEFQRPFVHTRKFQRHTLPAFLEGPTKFLKLLPDKQDAARLHSQVMNSELYDQKLGMFRVCTSLANQSFEIGRARAFTPGWLENESIWTHMSFKYLLALLESNLYEDFNTHFQKSLPINMDPQIYGRSPLENCSFLVSSANPDKSLHGAGFVARLSGVAAEFISIWRIMMAGKQPFFMQDGNLNLSFKPVLPSWLFSESGTLSFTFLGQAVVKYYNASKLNTYSSAIRQEKIKLSFTDGNEITIQGDVIGHPFAGWVRDGRVNTIEIFLEENP